MFYKIYSHHFWPFLNILKWFFWIFLMGDFFGCFCWSIFLSGFTEIFEYFQNFNWLHLTLTFVHRRQNYSIRRTGLNFIRISNCSDITVSLIQSLILVKSYGFEAKNKSQNVNICTIIHNFDSVLIRAFLLKGRG